jgi:hypothetical protein
MSMLEEALFFVIQAWCFHSHLNPTIMRKTHRGRIQAEDAEGKQGDELVVDVNTQADNVRLAQNVVEAFLKRGV